MFTNIVIQDTSVLFTTNIAISLFRETFGDFWVSDEGDGDFLVAGQSAIQVEQIEGHMLLCSEGQKLMFRNNGEVYFFPAGNELTTRYFSPEGDQSLEYNEGIPFPVKCGNCGHLFDSDKVNWDGPLGDTPSYFNSIGGRYRITCKECLTK